MQSSNSRCAPDPAALAQGHRALARSRAWAIATVVVAAMTYAGSLALDPGLRFPLIVSCIAIVAAVVLLCVRLAPTHVRPDQPVEDLPSAGIRVLVELLERACKRLERGQDDVFDMLYLEYVFHDFDPRDRAWLDARGISRNRLFNVATNWLDADHPNDPELCRAIHREVSLMLAAIFDREYKDPYRASLGSQSLGDLIGLSWLRAGARRQDAALRHNRARGRRLVGWTAILCAYVAMFAALDDMDVPLEVCMPGVDGCRFAFGLAELVFASAVLAAMLPLIVCTVSAAQLFIARRSFAIALPGADPA